MECKVVSDAPHRLPTRLLEIGEQNYQLRLCIAPPPGTNYATLSHCWGRLKFLTLARSNLVAFQSAIPFGLLPKTFQDVVGIARKFGFQYLWIDSLCIIQDDREDWEREAPTMAHVYGGSGLNIAATGANDGREGLFFKRDVGLVGSRLVEAGEAVEWEMGDGKSWHDEDEEESGEEGPEKGSEDDNVKSKEEGEMSVPGNLEKSCATDEIERGSRIEEHFLATGERGPLKKQETETTDEGAPKKLFHCLDGDLYDRNFTRLPLVRRAWVFQERVLAPRTLHFGKTQIMWECQTDIFFETWPNGMQKKIGLDGDQGWVSARKKGFETSWGRVIEQYSMCALTQGTDKLLAVSGMLTTCRKDPMIGIIERETCCLPTEYE